MSVTGDEFRNGNIIVDRVACVPTVDNDIADEYRGETSNCILFLQFWTSTVADRTP